MEYLEHRLRLIQTIGSAKDKIRFLLDPLAEYLAALHLVELYGEDEQSWLDFLAQVDTTTNKPKEIKGFLLAVQDCYVAKVSGAKKTDFVPMEIDNQLAGLTPAAAVQPQQTMLTA